MAATRLCFLKSVAMENTEGLQRKMDLLVRNDEVLTIVATSEPKENDTGSFYILRQCQNATYTLKETIQPPEKCDIVEVFLNRYREVRSAAPAQNDIHFADHVGYVKTLLAQCHQSTSVEEHGRRWHALSLYILTACHGKMARRAEIGKNGGRKFFTYLTKSASEVPDHHANVNVDSLTSRQPSSKEWMAIDDILAHSNLYPDRTETDPVYDADSRLRLQDVLALSLRGAVEAIKALQDGADFQSDDNYRVLAK
jgi:hypothetical protein